MTTSNQTESVGQPLIDLPAATIAKRLNHPLRLMTRRSTVKTSKTNDPIKLASAADKAVDLKLDMLELF